MPLAIATMLKQGHRVDVLDKGERTINGEIWKWEVKQEYNNANKHAPYVSGDIIGPVSRDRPYGSRYGIAPDFDGVTGKPTKRQRIKAIRKGIERFFTQLDGSDFRNAMAVIREERELCES